MQVPEPCPFSDTCSSLGSPRCDGMLPSFPSYGTVITSHPRARTSGTPVNRIQPVVSIVSPILSFPLSSQSHLHSFDRLTRARSWHGSRLIRHVHVLQLIPHSPTRSPTRSPTGN